MSTPTETGTAVETPEEYWLARYAREHVAHLVVIALLALYPGIHTVLTTSPVGAEAVALLPDIETMTAVLYFGLFAMSFDFISGYTGYLSFGHAAFYGAGAYFVVLAANGKLPLIPPGTSFMLLLVLAGLTALVLAIAVGVVSFRLSGVYFAMITLGFAQVLYVFVRGWDYVGSNPREGVFVAGERSGFVVGVPFVDSLNVTIGQLTGDEIEGLLGTISLSAGEVSYYAIGAIVVGCYLAMQRILHSPFGRVMVAIRENEERARAVGYDTFRYKLAAFAVSGFFAGIAGALFAGFQRSVTPDDTFYFLVAGDALLASIIGGFGTLVGPLYGRLFDESVREFLSTAGAGGGLLPYLREHVPADVLATELVGGVTVQGAIEAFLNGHASLYLGLLFVVFVLYVPNGLLGTLRNRLGGTVASWTARRLERRR
ncbi:branched-chain amino acid ABC transporter permease [Halobacteriales archaeon QH_9_66_26]|nr:MAG: branched-chain amino acid ABC transporter permease [Halobacteriales archaeon QH_9_66_26]